MSIETAHATPNYVYTWAGFSAKFHRLLSLIGMGWISQCARLLIGGNRAEQMRELKHSLVIPFLGILVFLLAIYYIPILLPHTFRVQALRLKGLQLHWLVDQNY